MKNVFKFIINEFFEKELDVKQRLIEIPTQTNKIINLIGVRRCGKTYIMYQLINKLREKIDKKNIVYINFEDDRLYGIGLENLNDLIEAYFEMFPQKRKEKIYLFLDEIQEIEGWEKFVRRIYDTLNAQIYISGSSAKMLSTHLGSALRGRSISYEIFPLSFREFLNFKEIEINLYSLNSLSFIKNAFEEYLIKGGFPEVVLEENDDIKKRILSDYIDLIVYRDVIERYNIKNITLLKFIIKYVFLNPATLMSFTKFYNELKSQGFKLSKDTLFEYFSYLNDAYVVFFSSIYRNSIKEVQKNPKKCFIVDNGFNYVFRIKDDFSKLYENLVFLILRRKYKEIFYFRQNFEVDFYIPNEFLINVSFDISDKKTLSREIRALKEAGKFVNVKELIIVTKEEEKIVDEIKFIPLWKFALEFE